MRASKTKTGIRQEQIARAALAIVECHGLRGLNIARVAEAAGVAKGTAYIYFATKEALFLELVRAELALWLDDIVTTLKRLRSPQPMDAVPAALARSMAHSHGSMLNEAGMHDLIDRLFGCEMPYFSPGGKPVLITYGLKELDERFER